MAVSALPPLPPLAPLPATVRGPDFVPAFVPPTVPSTPEDAKGLLKTAIRDDDPVIFLESEGVTFTAAVPTVWQLLLDFLTENKLRLTTLKRVTIGGSACTEALIRGFRDGHGVEVLHAWGMTELSPLGTLCTLKNKHLELPEDQKMAIRLKQGRAIFGIDFKIVDEQGDEQPNDGKAYGDLLVKGPWVIREYFKQEGGSPLRDGWFPTGDVATVDADGYLQITDRSKDVIKSGGEWISSVELENEIMAHGDVVEAAVVGVPDDRWQERPLACVVRKPGATAGAAELAAFLAGRVARWWVPERWSFVDEVPKTSVGKFDKKVLRARHGEGALRVETVSPQGDRTERA